MNAPTQITLSKPLLIEGVLHTSIPIRPPTNLDIASVGLAYVTPYARGRELILRVTGGNRKLLVALVPEDKKKVNDYLEQHWPE
ncbi:phage tail assembly protein [Methylorubrum sp. Q1]|uniref:phage tail assembly protein n=1 Tax=Methylorubrum sp. Q1 TaxID=2562453 RepID=UPI0010762728|nr:phage tail assembly protein [Methylorubrum sp. Q1]TFZ56060.1 phage tail assembly protein [Methylorubrum sp. Q1]